MKYIHTTAVLFVATLFLTTLFSSCSPDTEKEDGILIEMGEDGVRVTTTVDGVTTVHEERTGIPSAEPNLEPKPKPQPDWADNVITITVGRFDTKEGIVSEFRKQEKRGMTIAGGMKYWLEIKDPDNRGIVWEKFRITPPENAYEVDITLISLRDAGFKEPATIAEVRDRIIAMGFEPITHEEALEIRLQLKDQPRHGPWSYFRSLPEEEEVRRMYGGKEISDIIFNRGEKYGLTGCIYQDLGPTVRNDELILPSEKFKEQHPRSKVNPSFACAIPETRRRK